MHADMTTVPEMPPYVHTGMPIMAPMTLPMLLAAKNPDIIVALNEGTNSVKRDMEVTMLNSRDIKSRKRIPKAEIRLAPT